MRGSRLVAALFVVGLGAGIFFAIKARSPAAAPAPATAPTKPPEQPIAPVTSLQQALAGIATGSFEKPAKSSAETNYAVVETEKNETFRADAGELHFDGSTESGVVVGLGRESPPAVELTFEAVKGAELVPGDYPFAKSILERADTPRLLIRVGKTPSPETWRGDFVIWELETEETKIVRFAADFVLRATEKSPPARGIVRYRSTYE